MSEHVIKLMKAIVIIKCRYFYLMCRNSVFSSFSLLYDNNEDNSDIDVL